MYTLHFGEIDKFVDMMPTRQEQMRIALVRYFDQKCYIYTAVLCFPYKQQLQQFLLYPYNNAFCFLHQKIVLDTQNELLS
jgi:hypothetical protein